MPGGIGFYVHHHGRGHANCVRQILPYLTGPVTIFGSAVDYLQDLSSDQVTVVSLASDVVDIRSEEQDWPAVLHYAPLNVPGIRERMFRLAEWAYRTPPALLVVDVSVEITLLSRLLSVPTVVMRQSGKRDDLAHHAAYQSAQGLLAPYVATLEEINTPDWVRDKTYYAGGFSRYANRTISKAEARTQLRMHHDRSYAVVMSGLGGTGSSLAAVRQAARTCPDWEWWVVGMTSEDIDDLPANVRRIGKVDDTFPYLVGADVIVASAGNNTVMEIATAGTPYLCIPEVRPFDEQASKAEGLRRMNAALVLSEWPEPTRWPGLLTQVRQTDRAALTSIVDPRGAERCADYIQRVAEENSA